MRNIRKHLKLSPSGLATVQNCLHKARYIYAEGLRTKEDKARFGEGTLTHAILESVFKGEATIDQGYEVAQLVADSGRWDRTPSKDQIAGAYRRAKAAHRLFSDIHPEFEVVSCEGEVSGLHPEDPTIEMTGRVDLLIHEPRGYFLYDWKTSTSPPKGGRRGWNPDLVPHYAGNTQATHYCALLEADGKPVTWAGELQVRGPSFSPAGEELPYYVGRAQTTPTPRALANHLRAVLEVAERLRAEPKASDRTLGSCFSFGSYCEHGGLCAAELEGDFVSAELLRERWRENNLDD